ncbi:hypothetical protein ACWEVD_30015 [Nocardia thailandica]
MPTEPRSPDDHAYDPREDPDADPEMLQNEERHVPQPDQAEGEDG